MKREREETEMLTGEDARFVERLRALYAPEPRDAAARAAFDARLRERTLRRSWRRALLPAFSAAALAALLCWNALPGTRGGAGGSPAPAATASQAGAAWEQTLFYGDPTRAQTGDESDELPPDYAAIEGLFFDDV
jgi:hypothetical protein